MTIMLVTIVFVGETKESDVVEVYNIHLHILTSRVKMGIQNSIEKTAQAKS